jgi:hypothetical protein
VIEDPKHHIKQIGANIVLNGVTITKEIQASVEAFRSGDFYGFGKNLGDAMMEATQPREQLFLF